MICIYPTWHVLGRHAAAVVAARHIELQIRIAYEDLQLKNKCHVYDFRNNTWRHVFDAASYMSVRDSYQRTIVRPHIARCTHICCCHISSKTPRRQRDANLQHAGLPNSLFHTTSARLMRRAYSHYFATYAHFYRLQHAIVRLTFQGIYRAFR